MRPQFVVILLIHASCSPSTRITTDGATSAGQLPPEQLFGNDRQIVADFAKIGTCVKDEQLDRTCQPYQILLRHLKTKSSPSKTREQLIYTLTNLLVSQTALSRQIAVESLFAHREVPSTIQTLRRALKIEKSPPIAAIILRQLCQSSSQEIESLALPYLAQQSPLALKIEAAVCLGLTAKISPIALQTLRENLRQGSSPRLTISLCAALGALRAKTALPDLVAQLAKPEVGGPCSAALAALGTAEAYQALTKILTQPDLLSAQHISALLAFQGHTFFDQEGALTALARIVVTAQSDWTTRSRAVEGLKQLGGTKSLQALASNLTQKKDRKDDQILERVRRALAPAPRSP